MPESGEWFSARTRPEMLTSDDPPVRDARPERVRILAGPATPVGRAVAPLRRAMAVIPALGRRIIRVGDEPSRWQLAGMWTTGSAIVAGAGLAVAAVLGGGPPALTQPFERLSVLPGLSGDQSSDEPVSSADTAKGDPARTSPEGGAAGQKAGVSSGSGSSGYSGDYSGGSYRGGVAYPEDLVPGQSATGAAPGAGVGPGVGASQPAPAGGGTGSTAPAPGGSSSPPAADPPPVVADPTPTAEPTPSATPDPTEPAPTETPTPTVEPPTEPAPADPSADPAPTEPAADPTPADAPIDSPPPSPTP